MVRNLPSRRNYYLRLLKYFSFSLIVIGFSLGVGTAGYKYYGHLSWIDAFLNASMILTGMGPVNPMQTEDAKLFAGIYALYSGIAFLSTVAILFTPILQRVLHKIHLDLNDQTD